MTKAITHGWVTAEPDAGKDVDAPNLNDHQEVYSGLTAGHVLRASGAAAADFAAIQDADLPSTIARDAEVTAAVAAEAALARNADNLASGTVADARIAATIARDSEVTAAVSAEATARDAAIETHRADSTNVHGITDTANLSAVGHAHAGEDITSGTVADGRVAGTLARDSETTAAVAAEASARDAAIATHAGLADPHPGYLTPAEGNAAYDAAGAAAAAVATGAADVDAHEGAGDPHAGYRLESANHSHATSGAEGGQVDHGALGGLADDDHPQYATNAEFDDHNARHEPGGGDPMAVDAAQATGSLRTITTSAAQAVGTAAAGNGVAAAASNHVHPTGAGTPSTQAFGDAAATGSGPAAAMTDHKHEMPANPAGTPLVGDRVVRTAGDLATTSTTLVDATGMSITLTTGAHKLLIGVVAMVYHNSNQARVILDIDIDGSNLGGTNGLAHQYTIAAATDVHNASFTWMTDAVSAASHTIKLRWKVAAGTGNIFAGSTSPLELWVLELPF